MKRLPERIRRTLEKIVRRMRVKENVYGVGLFGSWSRGDAADSSDVDLLIPDKRSVNHEFVERAKINGIFIDFDHIPKRWADGPIPPELDEKLYNMKILYDRDWSLTNAKLLMNRSFDSPERIEIRTKAHVVESDIYLSRATSAFSRKDYRSTQLFSLKALEQALRIFIETTLRPFSNSLFIQRLEESTAELCVQNLFAEYLKVSGLGEADSESFDYKMKLFQTIWNEIFSTIEKNSEILETSHSRIRTKLKYYLNPAFMQGMTIRAKSLADSELVVEAVHYLKNIMLDIIENYAWLKSSIEKARMDNTTLIRSLQRLEANNVRNYENIMALLDLSNIEENDATSTMQKARKIIVTVRRKRKILIKNHPLEARSKSA